MSCWISSIKYAADDAGTPSHYHDAHQLLFITKGQIQIQIDDRSYTASEGSLVIISRLEQHCVRVLPGEYCRYMLRVSSTMLSDDDTQQVLLSLLENRPEQFCHILDVRDQKEQYAGLFRQILEAYNQQEVLRDYYLNLLFFQLLTMIYRRQGGQLPPQEREIFFVIGQVKNEFMKNIGQPVSLGEVAKKYHISPSYLSHMFRQVTGTSVMNYLKLCRIFTAKKLLLKSNKTVGEIVAACGFSDHSNFSRSFKEECGMTPLEYRRFYRSEKQENDRGIHKI